MWIQLTLCCLIALCSSEKRENFLESAKYSKGDSILWYILQKLHHDDKRIDEIQKSVHEIQKTHNLHSKNPPDKNKNEERDSCKQRPKKTISDLETDIRELKHTVNKQHPWIKDGYMGCFKDDGNRHLKYRIARLSHTTLLMCKQHCHGFKYTGLQFDVDVKIEKIQVLQNYSTAELNNIINVLQ
ncbi:unnamed protein product [Mytilus coruscus]|uniref:Uncharacterized protein n=1 Tax=Mytilus coruscus TaxID=42192 RepID=A0A6J8EWW3_MYTCO|nr:unnamed protein product [Mytilus coruscus]